MITFGLIAEGATDMTVLENILLGYFNDVEGEKIEVNFCNPIQMKRTVLEDGLLLFNIVVLFMEVLNQKFENQSK